MAVFTTSPPVWSRTEPFSWASAALTCANAAFEERRRTRAQTTNTKQRFICPPVGNGVLRTFVRIGQANHLSTRSQLFAPIPEPVIVSQAKQKSRDNFNVKIIRCFHGVALCLTACA